MKARIRITSRLPASSRPALETLLFFNTRQHHFRDAIEDSIARYGLPEIVDEAGTLRVTLAALPGVQCLYAVRHDMGEARPIGVVIYARDSVERFTVVHVGVADDATVGGAVEARHVLVKLLQEIRRIARRTTGIRLVAVAYRQRRPARAGYAATA